MRSSSGTMAWPVAPVWSAVRAVTTGAWLAASRAKVWLADPPCPSLAVTVIA